jgi:hypothetical protein
MSESRANHLDFLVARPDWQRCRVDQGDPPADPGEGKVLFRVDRFALTANNISYAKAGDMLRYWDFFPAQEGWGRIPAMGFADVLASGHPGVAPGERVFGFFPMSRYLVIEPSRATPAQIVDGAAHREGIAPAYNTYSPVGADPTYSAEHEDAHMLMRGLFMTSFLIDDFARENDLFGAEQVVIASASSKTAIALAFLVSRSRSARVIGLTSPRNAAFVKGLGYYDEVVLYDDVEALPARPTIFVDMAGSGDVTNRVHRHLGGEVRHSCSVGATHWDASPRDAELPGASPEFFFAPGQMQKRAADWGPDGLNQRIASSWTDFRDASDKWLEVVRGSGPEAVEQVFRETLEGRTLPSQGHVLSMWKEETRCESD